MGPTLRTEGSPVTSCSPGPGGEHEATTRSTAGSSVHEPGSERYTVVAGTARGLRL